MPAVPERSGSGYIGPVPTERGDERVSRWRRRITDFVHRLAADTSGLLNAAVVGIPDLGINVVENPTGQYNLSIDYPLSAGLGGTGLISEDLDYETELPALLIADQTDTNVFSFLTADTASDGQFLRIVDGGSEFVIQWDDALTSGDLAGAGPIGWDGTYIYWIPDDAKGSIYAGTGFNVTEVTVGTDGQFLKADSGETNGLAWADLALADISDAGSLAALDDLSTFIGTDVQAWDDDLDDLAALTPTKGNLIVGNGTDWVAVGVGTDGQVLEADSGETAGVAWATPSGGGGNEFEDDVFRILDDGDNTKEAAFQASGITTGTTRTFTFPDASGTLSLEGHSHTLSDVTDAGALAALDDLSTFDTGDLSEGSNLYYTDGRADARIAAAVGVSVQAYDAELAALAGLTSAADKLPYFTGSGTASLADLTTAGRALLDDADASAQRTTLGLGALAVLSDLSSFDTDDLNEGSTNKYYADSLVDTWLTGELGVTIQAYDAELAAIAGLTSAADRVPYFTGSGTAALATFSSFGRSLVDDADASAARTTLGLAIGSDVQAHDDQLDDLAGLTPTKGNVIVGDGSNWVALGVGTNDHVLTADSAQTEGVKWAASPAGVTDHGALTGLSDDDHTQYHNDARALTWLGTRSTTDLAEGTNLYFTNTRADDRIAAAVGVSVQAYDAELAALAGLTSAANKLPYFTGSGTASLADLSSFGRSLIDDADASAARTTLGVAIGSDVQAYDAELAAIAGLTSAADRLPYFTGSGTASLATFTPAARSLLDDASVSAMRTTLGLAIGSDVQAYDADLAAIAALSPTKGNLLVGNGSAWVALGVGTNDHVLTADSAESSGVKWAAAAGGGSIDGSGTANYMAKWSDSDTLAASLIYEDSAQNQHYWGSGAGNPGTSTGDYGVYIGYQAGYSLTSGADNYAIGTQALYSCASGTLNVAMGAYALLYATQSYHCAIGYGAGQNQTTGYGGTYLGLRAGQAVDTGNYNTFVGYDAGGESSSTGTITGSGNVGIGFGILRVATSAQYNFCGGYEVCEDMTTGQFNIALGFRSMQNATTAHRNVFLGVNTAQSAVCTGSYNVGLGHSALKALTSGIDNYAIGQLALGALTSGNYNTAMGRQAGYSTTTGSYNVFIGYQAGYNETGSNMLYIDNSSSSTPLILGDFANNWLKIHNDLILPSPTVPGSASATGTAGTISWDASYIYVCTATNTWKRAALSTW